MNRRGDVCHFMSIFAHIKKWKIVIFLKNNTLLK